MPKVRSFLAMFVGMLLSAFPALALPEVRVGTGFAVTPEAARTYYQGQGMTSPAWSEDLELKKLAAALGNDPDRIYEYVRNEIDVIPLFGVHAGARGAFIDKAGTPFDQAQMMVELLRSAGVTATYQLGTITLSGAQFNDWFGTTNADAARKLLADSGYPATVSGTTTVASVTMMHLWVKATIGGQVYAFDPSFKSHTVTTGIDVAAAMGFNSGTFWSNAISGATTSITNAPQVSNLNRAGVRTNLAAYATTLLNHIKTNLANASIEDVIGGRSIVPYNGGPVRQTSLPYQAATYESFANDIPLCLRTQVTLHYTSTNPQQSHTQNWPLDDIYGLQIAFEAIQDNPLPPAPSQYRVLLGEQDISGWINGTPGGGVSVNNPYAAGTSAGVVDGTYMDHGGYGGGGVGSVQIIVASGRPSREFAQWQERRHTGRQSFITYRAFPGDEAHPIAQQIASRRRMATAWLVQFQEMTNLVARLANAEVVVHNVVGIATATATHSNTPNPVATSFMISMEPAISAAPKDGDASQAPKVVRTIAMMASALEGSITQQVADSVYPVSAVAQLDWAHAGPGVNDRTYYHATAANWTWVKSQILLDYDNASPMRGQAEAYINAGYTVLIPKSSFLGPAPAVRSLECTITGSSLGTEDYEKPVDFSLGWRTVTGQIITVTDDGITARTVYLNIAPNRPMAPTAMEFLAKWQAGLLPVCTNIVDPDRAGAFIAINPATGAVAHISARLNAIGKGGGGTSDVETNAGRLFSISPDFVDKQYTARAAAANVDLKSGTLEYTPPPDIVVGNGGYPYSLSFQRSYRSGIENPDVYIYADDPRPMTHARDPIFGLGGWTSNIRHYAQVASDGLPAFGRDDPRAAAETLVAAQVLLSLMGDGATALETLERQIIGSYAAFWWTDTILLNAITINQGHASRSFVKLADGTYTQRGSAETVELLGGRENYKPPAKAHTWWYKTCVKVTGASRDVAFYGRWGSGYTSCLGHGSGLRRGSEGVMGFARHTFPFGVTVTWDETTRVLSNNLGRSLTISGVSDEGGGGMVGDGTRSVVFAKTDATLVVTDAVGKTWTYPDDAGVFEVRPPSNPNAAILRVEYTGGGLGVVDKVKDALGNTTIFNIGGGRVSSVVDPLGNATRTTHDRFGNVVRIEDPLGRVATTDYDNLRRKVKVTAPEGNFATYTYDERSNVLSETQHVKPGSTTTPASRTVSTKTYDALCNMVLTDKDALDRTTASVLNPTTCQVTSLAAPDGGVTTFAYNAIGQVSQKTDPTGLVTQMTYNTANGTLTSVVVDPGTAPHIAATTAFAYDAVGNITSLTDPRGFVHTATYDTLRRLTQYTAPSGTAAVTKWTYDVDGLVTKIERATGNAGAPWATTQYGYFPTGRVASTTDADGRITRYTYDAANRLSVTIDPENRRTKKIYDAAGQVIEERRGVGSPDEQAYATFGYTANGKQAWIKDAKLNQTSYVYDGYDRLETTTFPDATYEQLAYTIVDTVASKRTRGNQLIVNTYDVMDRLATHLVPQPTGPAILTTTTYDAAGRPTSISDNTGHSLVYAFDSAKRVVSVTQAAPTFTGTRVVSYTFDPAGNKTRTTWADGYYVQYQYDALNRMTTATENGTFLLATYIYDPLGRGTSLVYGNGASQGYAYSTEGDPLTLVSTLSGTSNTYTNTFTNAHQLGSESASNAAWAFVPTVPQTTNYSAANNLNQYVNITVGANPTVTMVYDANGNLTSDGTWTFTYDAQNMLRSAASAGSTSTYQYDPMGRRQMLTEGGVTTTFLHDGDEEIADYDAATVLRRYVPGPGTDMPIAMVTPSGGSSTRKYFHTNRQGSTIVMSADDATMAEGPYTYDAYGNGAATTGVPFKYTGRRLDAGTGLYYYRARYYSANLGRFLQVDPIGYGDQMSLYGYVGNDPLNNTDPTGEDTVSCHVLDGKFQSCSIAYDNRNVTDYNFYVEHTVTINGSPAGTVTHLRQGSLPGSFSGAYGTRSFIEGQLAEYTGRPFSFDANATPDPFVAVGGTRWPRHHPYPMYLGGAAQQELVKLPPSLHRRFHAGLDGVWGRWRGKEYYDRLSPAARRQVLRDVKRYVQDFDRQHGTKLYQAMLRNGFPKDL